MTFQFEFKSDAISKHFEERPTCVSACLSQNICWSENVSNKVFGEKLNTLFPAFTFCKSYSLRDCKTNIRNAPQSLCLDLLTLTMIQIMLNIHIILTWYVMTVSQPHSLTETLLPEPTCEYTYTDDPTYSEIVQSK